MHNTVKRIDEITATLHAQLSFLKEFYHVESLKIFGSYLRDGQTENSDLDILVTLSEVPGLLKYIELENYLSDLVGIKVDLVMEDALKPHIGARVRREALSARLYRTGINLQVLRKTACDDLPFLKTAINIILSEERPHRNG